MPILRNPIKRRKRGVRVSGRAREIVGLDQLGLALDDDELDFQAGVRSGKARQPPHQPVVGERCPHADPEA